MAQVYSTMTSHKYMVRLFKSIITLFIWRSKDNVYVLETMYQYDSNIGIYIGVLQVHTIKIAVGNIALGNLFC